MTCDARTIDHYMGIEGSWEREARRVAALAGELGVALDEQRILYFDVRELVTLRLRLQAALERPEQWRWPWEDRPSRLVQRHK